jgi:hypothetical protein
MALSRNGIWLWTYTAVRERAAAATSMALTGHTSLVGYVPLPGRISRYLDDRANIQGTTSRMMTKVRLGHLMVLATVGRMLNWPACRARCVLCGDGIETVQHFVSDCKFLAPVEPGCGGRSVLHCRLRALLAAGG